MRLSFIDCRMVSCSVSHWAVLGTFAVISLSPGVSTAKLSCWLVLIRCNLSLSSGVFNCQPFVLVGSQLLTFRAGWCSSAVIFLSGVSAAVLLVHGYFSAVIFLSPQGFQLPFFCIHEYFSASCSLASLSSAVSAASPYLHVVAE